MHHWKKGVALLTACALMVSAVPAFAEETTDQTGTAIVAETTETTDTEDTENTDTQTDTDAQTDTDTQTDTDDGSAEETTDDAQEAVSIESAEISSIEAQVYTGSKITPAVTVTLDGVTLTQDVDYTVDYSSNKSVGTATVTITGIGSYTGTAETTFKITKANQTITSKSSYSKNTASKAFKLNASATAGKLTYKTSNKKVATVSSAGKVTIKGTGTATITITAKATTNYKKATKTVTITVVPKKVKWKYARSNKVKSVKVGWKRDPKIDGYQIQISRSKTFSKVILTTNMGKKKIAVGWKGFLKGKKYYFRIRSYKTVGGVKYYSAWSTTKVVKVRSK